MPAVVVRAVMAARYPVTVVLAVPVDPVDPVELAGRARQVSTL
jgi:hypothetical protein